MKRNLFEKLFTIFFGISFICLIFSYVLVNYPVITLITISFPFLVPITKVVGFVFLGISLVLLIINLTLINKLNKNEIISYKVNDLSNLIKEYGFEKMLENTNSQLYVKEEDKNLFIFLISNMQYDKDILNLYYDKYMKGKELKYYVINIIRMDKVKNLMKVLKSDNVNFLNLVYDSSNNLYFLKLNNDNGLLEQSVMFDVLNKVINFHR